MYLPLPLLSIVDAFDTGDVVIVITILLFFARITNLFMITKEFAKNSGMNTNIDNFKSDIWNNFPL